MPDQERIAREDFYRNLLWIVDGRSFRNRFRVLHPLPDPNAPIAEDIVWFPPHPEWRHDGIGFFYRLSEVRASYPEMTIAKSTIRSFRRMVEIHELTENIRDDIRDAYVGHHQYFWVRPRKTWLESPCPVFLDFGHDWVAKLGSYDDYKLPCVRIIAKSRLVGDAMSCYDVRQVGEVPASLSRRPRVAS